MRKLSLSPDDALMIGIDCSGSMNERDCVHGTTVVTRTSYARQRAMEIIAQAERVGVPVDVVGFGTVLRPMLGLDVHAAVKRFPNELTANESGTCIGALAAFALKRLDGLEASRMTLLIFTDGGASDPETALEAITENERRGIAVRFCPFSVGEVDLSGVIYGTPQVLADWAIEFDLPALRVVPASEAKPQITVKINGCIDEEMAKLSGSELDAYVAQFGFADKHGVAIEARRAGEDDAAFTKRVIDHLNGHEDETDTLPPVLSDPPPTTFDAVPVPVDEPTPVEETRAALADAPSRSKSKKR